MDVAPVTLNFHASAQPQHPLGRPAIRVGILRRQLRESLLWGTGLFEIKRGDQTFLRLVKFAEPPKK